jgi:hypothetical protein
LRRGSLKSRNRAAQIANNASGPNFMSKTSLKNIQKQKKKARRVIARPAQSRIQGNTVGVRSRLKKLAGSKARAKKASA